MLLLLFRICLPAISYDTRVSVLIYDLVGRLVFTGSYQVGAHADLKLSIPSKLHGCYLMRVVAGKEMVEKKLMLR